MATLTITNGGKITLPDEMLDHLGVSPGERIEVLLLPDQKLGFRAASKKAPRAGAVTTARKQGRDRPE